MIEHPSPQGAGTDRGHIRLVDDIRQSLPVAPVAPKTDKKMAKKKAGKRAGADEPARVAARSAEPLKSKPGKLKGPKALVKRVVGLQATLDTLKMRLDTMDSARADQAGATARLSRRLDEMEREAESAIERRNRIQGRLEALERTDDGAARSAEQQEAVEAVRAGLARIVDRMASVETRVGELADRRDDAPGLAPQLADVEGRIIAVARMLEAQRGKLDQLERAVAESRSDDEARGATTDEIDRFHESVDGRVTELATGLARVQSEQQRWAARIDDLPSTRGGAAGGLALVLLMLAVVLGLGWWYFDAGSSAPAPSVAQAPVAPVLSAPQVAPQPTPLQTSASAPEPTPQVALAPELASALERITQRLERLQATDPSGVYTSDLLDRLARLETGMLDLTRSIAQGGQQEESLSRRLAELTTAQQDLARRIDELETENLSAAAGRSAPDVRADHLAGTRLPEAARDTADATVIVGASGAFGVQLVVYRSQDRVAPFAARYGVAENARSLEIRIGGRAAYAVVLGPFATETEAAAASAGLGAELKALGPWIRPLSPGARLTPVR